MLNNSRTDDRINEYINNLKILYEDNHIIAVVKPANVLSQKDSTNDIDMNEIIKGYLKNKYNKPGNVYLGLIHRLDRRVEGVMVFAKTSKAAKRLSTNIKENQISKKYYAVVLGELTTDSLLQNYIYKDEKNKMAKIVDKLNKDAKEAILKYKVVRNVLIADKVHTILDVELITGRYNQIRCQLAHINHPLLNDYKYGYPKKGSQLGLCCYNMSIVHPITTNRRDFYYIPNKGIWEGII